MDTEHAREFEEHGIQAFRIDRGAEVLGTDGSLGTVEQIVVNGTTGELQSLVVRGEAGMSMELPATRIESATGDRVYLSLARADLAAHPELARPFQPEMYIPVDSGAVVPPEEVVARDADTPLLTEIEENAVEIVTPTDDVDEDSMLAEADADEDIAEQPTIVLGPETRPGMQSGMVGSSAVASVGGAPDAGPSAALDAELLQTAGLDDAAELDAEDEALDAEDEQPGAGTLGTLEPEPLAGAGEAAVLAEMERMTAAEPATPEPATPEPTMAGPVSSGTTPRVAEGAAYGQPPQGSLGVYVTTGILAGTAVASVAYLWWSRRQRARRRGPLDMSGLSVNQARARLQALRDVAANAQQTLSTQARTRSARLAPRRLNAGWRSAQSRMGDWWEQISDQASDLSGAVGDLVAMADRARRRVRGTSSTLPSAGSVAGTLASRLPTPPAVRTATLRAWLRAALASAQDQAGDLTGLLRGWGGALGSRLTPLWSGRPLRLAVPTLRLPAWRRATARMAPQLTAEPVVRKAREVSKATRRTARRAGRRMRWFRRGLMAGTVWGILYAPAPGRQTRTTAARYLTRVPFLRDYIGAGETTLAPGTGGTGPHPRTDVMGKYGSTPSGVTSTPLLEATSEEPLLSAPEGDVSSLPGA